MRTVQMELLRPGELLEEQKRISLVYLPIGPVEWHRYHMPLGTDGLCAQESARALARVTGGVVAPTLFIGTERNVPDTMLENLGVAQKYTLGMDYDTNIWPSMYFREEVFGLVVSEELRLLVKMGYRMIVIVNGHGASGQVNTLCRLADQVTNETGTYCLFSDYQGPRSRKVFSENHLNPGHADRCETALMMALTESVDLAQLPERSVPLHTPDFGIASGSQFGGFAPKDGVVQDDPRDATRELGRAMFDSGVEDDAEHILAEYRAHVGAPEA